VTLGPGSRCTTRGLRRGRGVITSGPPAPAPKWRTLGSGAGRRQLKTVQLLGRRHGRGRVDVELRLLRGYPEAAMSIAVAFLEPRSAVTQDRGLREVPHSSGSFQP
jgi:hypothetical protein